MDLKGNKLNIFSLRWEIEKRARQGYSLDRIINELGDDYDAGFIEQCFHSAGLIDQIRRTRRALDGVTTQAG